MASFLKKALLLAASLTCFIHLATGLTPVTGISVPAGTPIPQRLEINTFCQNSTFLNIFYLALSYIQGLPSTNLLSFYRLSGIHGTTYAWDGDTGGMFGYNGGYCHHGDVIFPTWHRPYLSLYEKTLLDSATSIVNTFPAGTVKDQHIAALKVWRHPYWDWAKNGTIPSVINSQTTVSVTTVKNGVLQSVSIVNPLYSYPTDPNDPNTRISGTSTPKASTVQTVRNPTVTKKVYVSRPTVTNQNMNNARSSLKTYVYQAFTLATTYNAFATSSFGDYSIEGPHGSVHVTVGGSSTYTGHMTSVPIAAFDPIFYLHHCNIDRYIAMWQVMYPNSYVSSTDTINTNTPLNPFKQANGQYWTSALVKNISVFGYAYPETINCNQVACMTAQVNALYGSGSSKKKRDTATDSEPYNEYLARIKAPNTCAYGSFSVKIFFGEPSANESDYATDPNYVGSFDVFTAADIPESHKKIVRGTVSLTTALSNLVDAGKLTDMEPKTVKAYVKDNLKWIIIGPTNGYSYNLDGFDIVVITAKVKPRKDDYSLPKWGDFSTVYKVV